MVNMGKNANLDAGQWLRGRQSWGVGNAGEPHISDVVCLPLQAGQLFWSDDRHL